MSYCIASKIREYNKKKGFNTASDLVEGLDKMVGWHLEQACKRAGENGRKTVRDHDVIVGAKEASEALVMASKVKEVNKKHDCNTSGEFMNGVNAVAYWYLDMAQKRADSNGRKTVRAADL